jgi:sec-independent protein translocase protein TatB
MGFSETIFLFLLALLIFGPKKLPDIARQLGKMMTEFKRASNEFRSQIEAEISQIEVDGKQQILPPSEPPRGAINHTPMTLEGSAASASGAPAVTAPDSPVKVAPDA